MALPDKLYLPFAENHDLIGPVLSKTLSGKEHKEALSRIKALAKHIKAGRESVLEAIKTEKTPALLTKRASEVACMVADGFTNLQIANELQVSVSTIKDHLQNIRKKTGAKGRGEFHKIL